MRGFVRYLGRDLKHCPDGGLSRLVTKTVGQFRDASLLDRGGAVSAIAQRMPRDTAPSRSAFQTARDGLRFGQRPLADSAGRR